MNCEQSEVRIYSAHKKEEQNRGNIPPNYYTPTMKIEVDQGNNCIKYCPDDGTQSGTIILMHGLGDSADGLDVSIFDLFLLTRQK